MITSVLLAAATLAQPCIRVEADKITGGDLAAASPLFAGVPAETFVAYTPSPGNSRFLRPEDLRKFSDAPDLPNLCFTWAVTPLNVEEVRASMLKSLAMEGAEIEVLDLSRDAVPAGEILFSLTGLPISPSATGGVVWRGQVRYGNNRRADIWARVKVAVPFTRIVAAAPIKTGDILTAAHIRIEQGKGMPSSQPYAAKPEEVLGRMARRSFTEGAPLTVNGLGVAPDIRKGDNVQVKVQSGAAKLEVEGLAESSGAVGDLIAIRNPSSGKVFRARVEGNKSVSVTPGVSK